MLSKIVFIYFIIFVFLFFVPFVICDDCEDITKPSNRYDCLKLSSSNKHCCFKSVNDNCKLFDDLTNIDEIIIEIICKIIFKNCKNQSFVGKIKDIFYIIFNFHIFEIEKIIGVFILHYL